MLPNSTNVGAVVGTPGTLPTGFGINLNDSLAMQIVGFGNADPNSGAPYIDIKISGTTTGASGTFIVFNTGTEAAGVLQYVISAYLAVVAGSQANLTDISLTFDQTVGGADGATVGNGPNLTLTGTTTRYSVTGTMPGGTTGFLAAMAFGYLTGAVIDVTVRIAGIQFEQAATPTAFQTTPGYNPSAYIGARQIAPMMAR